MIDSPINPFRTSGFLARIIIAYESKDEQKCT